MSKLLLRLALPGAVLFVAASAQPLRDLAAQRGIRMGAAADPGYFFESAYFTILGSEFSQL